MSTYPDFIAPRPKGGRREIAVKLDYGNVLVLGEYDGLFGWGTRPERGELLLVGGFNEKGEARLFPCCRKKSDDPERYVTAICHDENFKSLPASFTEFQCRDQALLDALRPKGALK